ncbi:type II toxin-antitoxin system VapC family toxin [Amycolatopsis balhimycina DSM 5908]|uniref:Ribonuclease VapC n=1 Tax=Amycolatopsis balhimycina DSM 5908 TaxID=1081091 RepID=A0A428WIW1_AMYBA|nr:PIN domain-containing protein [Amycolatopsis balhimycina]RSM43021.1 type II toxin-antitoxin system VapC family toxin [Amycolatopsis balhimycina DSM 5908]
MARLILDTGVLVDAARQRLPPGAIGEEDDVAIPALAITEYRVGLLLDPNPARRAAHDAFLADFLAVTPVVDYSASVVDHHAELLVHLQRTGQARGAHDLIIAATARATGRTLVTTDGRARFGDLPDVEVRLLERIR